MNKKSRVTIEEILDDVLLQESTPDHQALLRWCSTYPEHREAITDFFATWAVSKEGADIPAVDEDRVASMMVSHALNLLYHQQTSEVAEKQVSSERRLYKMIDASVCSDEILLSECRLDESLIAKLDRRLVVFASIPQTCIQNLARTLKCAVADVARVLDGTPIPLASYKAKGKPAVKQETFAEAVATSELPDEVKKEWERIASSNNWQ